MRVEDKEQMENWAHKDSPLDFVSGSNRDADFPLDLEKAVTRSFMEIDAAFAKSCSLESSLASGTTVLTAMIFGRSLLVANAGDSRAVLSWRGTAIEMSKDHRPCCMKERRRIESLV
ncbi:hypothetical protein V6N13_000404 [Hibiscus sabdariffa]|uniref:PPM-type phosphatase domain-containing protein n=1 Tax=Hibiscus sabdariffa TaxID=183260 RepID=A0ABR2G5S1_9ROSI